MATKSLWGELPSAEGIRTPLSLLREQASFLGEMTNKLLEARISLQKEPPLPWEENQETLMTARLSIVVPSLDGYQVTVLSMTFEIGNLYPVEVKPTLWQIANGLGQYDTEEAFREGLHQILNSEKTKQVIQSLLIQAKDASEIQLGF